MVNTAVGDNELIKHIGFLDDEKPQFVLLLTKHKVKPKMFVRLLRIKKEDNKCFNSLMNDIEH